MSKETKKLLILLHCMVENMPDLDPTYIRGKLDMLNHIINILQQDKIDELIGNFKKLNKRCNNRFDYILNELEEVENE